MDFAAEILRLSRLNEDVVVRSELLKKAAVEFTKGTRVCITCGTEKAKSEFYLKPGPKLDSYCKPCRREKTKANYRAKVGAGGTVQNVKVTGAAPPFGAASSDRRERG